MLESLYIKNYILVEELELTFQQGLNILTGETGAGKSIIISALGQLVGERGSPELVRQGAKKAVIEARIQVADMPAIKELLTELEIDWLDPERIYLRKEIALSGASRLFLNDTPVTLNRLAPITALLVDLHGQHQHQRLLHPQFHRLYLDGYGHLQNLAQSFDQLAIRFKKIKQEIEHLRRQQAQNYQQQDLYRYQKSELEKAQLRAGELAELKAEMKKLANVEKLHQLGANLAQLLYSGETNASDLLARAEHDMEMLVDLDQEFAPYLESLRNAADAIDEIGRFTQEYVTQVEFNPQRLEAIHQRISQIEFLLKKYQCSTEEQLLNYYQKVVHMLDPEESFDQQIARMEEQLTQVTRELQHSGEELHKQRIKKAHQFAERITAVLHNLGMPQARFKVELSCAEQENSPFRLGDRLCALQEGGFDRVQFLLQSNAGEPFRPLHKIASGGEISRIMLALKSVLAETDHIPILIFDEIDAGISGKIAQRVGVEMARLADFHQILCITHLPQIAVFAAHHLKVSKITKNNRTYVDVKSLDKQERITEIASLLGGEHITDHALKNAAHLIQEAQRLSKSTVPEA